MSAFSELFGKVESEGGLSGASRGAVSDADRRNFCLVSSLYSELIYTKIGAPPDLIK